MAEPDPVPGCSKQCSKTGKRRRLSVKGGKNSKNDEVSKGKEQVVVRINNLPDEVLLEIFSFIDPRSLMHTISKVSKRWAELAFDDSLWRKLELEVNDTDNIDETEELLGLAPALRKLTVWGTCPCAPFVFRMPHVQELVLKGSSSHDPDRPLEPESNLVSDYPFSMTNIVRPLQGSLERLTVMGEVTAEEFAIIDRLDLRELRMVDDNLRDFPCEDREHRRPMEYVHFEKDGRLCSIPLAILRLHKDSLRTVVGRVDAEGMAALAQCTRLEAADIDVPNVASLALLDGLQHLHTLRVSFRLSPEPRTEELPEDRVPPLQSHCSQRVRRLSVYQMPTTEVLPSSLAAMLDRYKEHLECLEIVRVSFRHNYHAVEVMRVIDQMTNLKVLYLGSWGWPAYPLSLTKLEVVRADGFSDWITTCLEKSQKRLKKIMCNNIPEIVCEHWLSNCIALEETVIALEVLINLNRLEHLRALTLHLPENTTHFQLEMGTRALSRLESLTAEATRGTSNDEETLPWLAELCPRLKVLHLRGWSFVAGYGRWLKHFQSVEHLTLDLSFPFYQSFIYAIISGAMPKLKTLVFEEQEAEAGVSLAFERLQAARPQLRVMGSWNEADPLLDPDLPFNYPYVAEEDG